jgi:DNA-binding beta-propeller fold protein YncE
VVILAKLERETHSPFMNRNTPDVGIRIKAMLFLSALTTWLAVSGHAESPGKIFIERLPKNIVTATIPVKAANVAAVSLDSKTLYVLNYGPANAVTVIDTATDAITSSFSVTLNVDAWMQDLVLSPDGQILYVEDSGGTNAVYMVDTATNTVTGLLPNYPIAPTTLAVSPDGRSLWEFSIGSISIVDIASGRYSGVVNIGEDTASRGGFTPDGGNVYVLSELSKVNRAGLFRLNRNSLPPSLHAWRRSRVTRTFKGWENAVGAVISPDGMTVYSEVVGERAGQLVALISVYDVTQQRIEKEIPIENYGELGQSAITPDGKYLFVPCLGGFVVMIGTTHNRVIGPAIAVGGRPSFVAIAPNGKSAYVTDFVNNLVSVIDISTQ